MAVHMQKYELTMLVKAVTGVEEKMEKIMQ